MLPNSRFALPLLTALLLLAVPVQAAMYKWTDADGNIHYTQSPPPAGVESKTMKAPPPAPTPAPSQKADKGEQGKGEAKDEADKPVETPRDEQIKRNCEAARRNLSIYTNNRRVMNEKGEIEVMDEKVRQAKIKQTEEQIKEYCK